MKTARTASLVFFLMRVLLLAVFGVGLAAMPKLAKADDIVDVDEEDVSDFCDDEEECSVTTISTIFDTSSSTTIYFSMESYTDNTDLYDVYGYSEYVEGELYDDDTEVGYAYASDAYDAYFEGYASINPANGDQAFAWPVQGYLCDEYGDCYEVTAAEADVDIGAPDISSKQPSYMFVGTSGTLTLGGTDFVDPFDENKTTLQLTLNGSSSGISFTTGSITATQASADYTVSLTAPTGNWEAGLDYYQGESGSYFTGVTNFTVGDPAPSISNVNPNQWTAGQLNFPVTISGSYFGSNPQLAVSGGGATATITSHTDNGQAGGATINASVSVPNACDASGTVTITVTSTGYNGTSFTPAYSGEPDSATSTATIVPTPGAAPDPPQIMFGGNNVAGATTKVVVGQYISLTGVVPTQACVTVQSWDWTPPSGDAGTAIGGYTPTFSSYATASVTGLPAKTTNPYNFYWVYPGTYTVSVKYTLTNGETSPNSTATFTVQGITSPNIKSSLGEKNDVALGTFVDNCTGDSNYKNDVTWLSLGQFTAESGTSPNCTFTIPNPGISFTSSGSTPKGNWFFVQLVTQNTTTVTTTTGKTSQSCGTGLDNYYPYAKNTSTKSTSDSPGTLVNPAPKGTTYTEISRSFAASMYAMWQSNTANSIPVPVGYVPWTALLDGLRSAKGVWSVAADSTASPGSFMASMASQASSGYPTWTTKVMNGTCTSYNIGTTD